MQLEICCPICRNHFQRDLDPHSCQLHCPSEECRTTFVYLGHCHLFLDLFTQAAELAEKGYRAAALVLGCTCLELYLEWFLVRKLRHDGWTHGAITRELRRQWQFSQRFGPVFRRVYGLSLEAAAVQGGGDGASVKTLARVYGRRNQVVHRGATVTEMECHAALQAIRLVYEALVRYAARTGLLSEPVGESAAHTGG